MAQQTTEQKLQSARKLIKDKRYAEARRILDTADHPTAKKWLARLDEIELEDPFEEATTPKNRAMGYILGGISLLTGVVGILIVIGLLTGAFYLADTNTTLFWAVSALVLLPVAYITNKVGRRLR